jgi:altronate dehydratase small subunit
MEVSDIILRLHLKDNVGILMKNAQKNAKACVNTASGEETITILEDIPFGFKIALDDISKGSLVYKYGNAIGRALININKGEMVHVHNIEGLLGNATN